MKKIYLTISLLSFCLTISACSFIPAKTNQVTENNSPQVAENKGRTASSAPTILNQGDVVDQAVSLANGENLKKFDEKLKNNKDIVLKDSKAYIDIYFGNQKIFGEICSTTEASYAKKIGVSKFDNGEVVYFWPDNEGSFNKNLIVYLAVKENLNCSAAQINKMHELLPSAPLIPSFLYERLANAMAADILLNVVVADNVAKHPEYCQKIAATYEMGKLCRAVKLNDAIKRLGQYYEITGFWDYFESNPEQFASSTENNLRVSRDDYLTSKISSIQQRIKNNDVFNATRSGLEASSSNPFWDMSSTVGVVETPYNILKMGASR
jgi:hypothetical protein